MSNVHEHKIRNIYADIANLDDDVKNNIWYVWQGATELYKIVFDVNYSAKINQPKRLINRIATAGKISISVLNMDTLHKIK